MINFNSNNLFETIFKHAHNGIAIISLEGKWLKVNKSVTDILGYSEDELYKISFQDITYKEDLELDLGYVDKLLKGELENYQIEKRYFHKDGHIVWALLSVSLVFDDSGTPQYFISQIVDITDRKRTEENTEMFLKVIENQNFALKRFANIATHDLRTHISNLVFISDFLKQDIEHLSDNEYFLMLKNALGELKDTIKHLDDITNAKAKNISEIKSLNLYDFVVNAIYNISALVKVSNCEIINSVNENLYVSGVEAYLNSIILNFLSNAIKYKSDKRQPKIELFTKEDVDYVILVIRDNGLGIDLNAHGDQLFEINTTFHNHKDSTGVGLFITKEQVEIIGGKIEVKSDVDVGTEFSVYFKKAKKPQDDKVSLTNVEHKTGSF